MDQVKAPIEKLKSKYQDVINLAGQLNLKDVETKEEGGKLVLKGTAPYQMEKDLLWDRIKTFSQWEKDFNANIKVEHTDIYGVYTVKSGDTLSKLAKDHLGDPKRYTEIFELNKDVLTNPDMIKVGQKLKIPKKQ
jgi:nucleoid-associated protein YgaU